MAKYSDFYRCPPAPEPKYRLGEAREIVTEEPYRYTVLAVEIVVSNGLTGRHVLGVRVAISAVSLTVGLILTEQDSRKVEAGDLYTVSSLADAVRGSGFGKFRTFPAGELGRFVL